ncbi:RteC domain-containing protein [uncultured Bacteroides sp.]|uniref:RteC domain-containing protein n=1 Tax=uncultured Bacteroides sp. TaxID=162156 RepID=UPI00280B1FEE|nr:RteC domain-containing protein [uncultured Bacteroides sp.]
MRTLTNTLLFNMFTSYVTGSELKPEELPAAYGDFVNLLAELPQDEDRIGQLRRLNYTRIELSFIQQAGNTMKEARHILYDVFIGKTLSLLDAEIEMMKDYFRHHADDTGMKMEIQPCGNKVRPALRWNGTDSDLIELVAALMAAGAVDCTGGKKLTIVDVIRVFEDAFNIKINALYTKRGKVFDRCTNTTPFIDSLRKSYNQMLDKRLA